MKINLQKLIEPTLFQTVLIYLVSFALWMFLYFINRQTFPMNGIAGDFAEKILPSSSLIAQILCFGIVVINSLAMAQLNNKFTIIRARTFMPQFVFLFLSVCWLPVHGNYLSQIALFFILTAISITFNMYKDNRAVEQAFLSFFLISIASLLIPEYAVLIIAFWCGYFYLNCFSGKTFFAGLWGFLTPWILLFSMFYFFWSQNNFTSFFQGFNTQYFTLNADDIPIVVYISVMILILIVAVFQMMNKSHQDNIQTRNELNFIRLIGVFTLLLLVFRFANYNAYLPLIAMVYALLVAYSFTLIKNLFNSLFFILFCAVNLLFVFYIVYLQYS
jgi:hypothetical protein